MLDFPRDGSIHRLFGEQAARTPEAIALVHHGRTLTYRQLEARANQLAHRLVGIGIGPGSLVAVCLERSPDMVAGLLGILKAGAAYVSLDPAYPTARLAFMLDDCRAAAILTQTSLARTLGETHAPVVLIQEIEASSVDLDAPGVAITAQDLAYVMYTSGSTGQPKGVAIPHRGVVRLLFGTDFAQLDETTTFLQMAPTPFDPSTLEIWGPLRHGGRCVLYPDRSPEIGIIIYEIV